MSERKVLNKYYPPDFDPSKIPRLRLPKNRQYTVRLMSPCNMRCNTCGDYIAKGKKFNARKETVETESYLGLKIFRFYFKCPRCMAEITFKTDPKSMDYEVEHGATPNFKALKLAEQQAEAEAKEKEEEEKLNPMKLLENRTKASRREMENLEALEDLKEINQRQININYETILEQKRKDFDEMMKRQEEEDEAFVRSVFPKSEDGQGIANRELPDSDGDSDDESLPKFGVGFSGKSTDLFSADDSGDKKLKLSNKRKLSDMIIVKKKLTPQVENGDNNRDKSVLNSNLSLNKSLLCSYSDSDSNE